MTAMTALAALILANPMRRGALEFVNLVSMPDFYSKQSESEHSFLILASATSSFIIFKVHKLSKFVHWRHQCTKFPNWSRSCGPRTYSFYPPPQVSSSAGTSGLAVAPNAEHIVATRNLDELVPKAKDSN
jgi:hypothetical protein